MAVILDTSILIDIERGRSRLPDEDELAMAAITVSELLQGVHRGGERQRVHRELFVQRLLDSMTIIPFDVAIARVHARLWSDLAAIGRVPPAHDLQIAASAVARQWPLATLDEPHFEGIPGLSLWRPAAASTS